MTAYTDAMRRYFTFSGRSSKSQFWYYHLVVLAIAFIGILIDAVVTDGQPLFAAVAIMAHYIPSLAIIVRRLHDSDKSGWLVLLCLIPLVGVIAFIAFGCMPATPGANRFGPATATGAHSATAAQTAVSGTVTASAVDRLEKLAALKSSGAIDDAEFARMKSEILGTTAA